MYQWHWEIINSYKNVFLQGALVTLWLTLATIAAGTVLGVIVAWAKRSPDAVVSFMAKTYIELFRALPILVLLIWIFYVVPILFDWRISPFGTAVLALSLHLSAFVAETVRAGIQAIPRSQMESGVALGMTMPQVMLLIIAPQALRSMLPNLMGLYINEIKNSSLASVIAVNELLHRSNVLISNTFRPLEIYSTVALAYLLLILPLVFLARRVERYLGRSDARAA